MFQKIIRVKAPAALQVLNMPVTPWKDLDEDDTYAWGVALGGAIAGARQGRVTILKDAAGQPVAQIGPPQADA